MDNELLDLLTAAHRPAPRRDRCRDCDGPNDTLTLLVEYEDGLTPRQLQPMCEEHAFGCVDCGAVTSDAVGTIQPLDEWAGWLVCADCFRARELERRIKQQLRMAPEVRA